MKKSKNKVWFLNWYKYCKAYLHLARIGLLELREQQYRDRFSLFNQSDIYEDKIVLIPIIWSLKHATELLLKAVDVRVTQEFLASHDISELQDEIRAALSSIGVTDTKVSDDLSAISEKYLGLKFWEGRLLSKSAVRDEQNDVFRYPESRVGFVLDIENIHKVSSKELLELEDDLEELERILHRLHSRITDAKIRNESQAS